MTPISRPTQTLDSHLDPISEEVCPLGHPLTSSQTLATPPGSPTPQDQHELPEDLPPPYSATEPALLHHTANSYYSLDALQARFFIACESQDLAKMETMIRTNPHIDINAKKTSIFINNEGEAYQEVKTLLMIASQLGNLAAVKMLVEAGASVHTKGTIQTRIRINPHSTSTITIKEATVLHAACLSPTPQSNPDLIYYLVRAGADIHAKARSDVPKIDLCTPLYLLCTWPDSEEMINFFIERGAKPEGQLPYIARAIRTNHSLACIKILLERKASPTYETPITEAAKQGLIEVAELLLRYGAELNTIENSPLQAAAMNSQIPMMQWLLERGANPSAHFRIPQSNIDPTLLAIKGNVYDVKMPPLFYAITIGDVKMTELLLHHKADIYAKATYIKRVTSTIFSRHIPPHQIEEELSLKDTVSLLAPFTTKAAITTLLRKYNAYQDDCIIS